MKKTVFILFSVLFTSSLFGQTTKSEICACNCSYSILYDDAIEDLELGLKGYKFTGIKPKESQKWIKELEFTGKTKITVNKKRLTEILDKVCNVKSKGTLLIKVDKVPDLDFASILLGYTKS